MCRGLSEGGGARKTKKKTNEAWEMGTALFLAFRRRMLSRSTCFSAPGQRLMCRISTHQVTANMMAVSGEWSSFQRHQFCHVYLSALLRSVFNLGEDDKCVPISSTVVTPQRVDSASSLGG